MGNPDITPCEMLEIIMIHYPELGNSRNLCFQDALKIDTHAFGKGGEYWRGAYNFPKESEIINIFDIQCEAINVGIFTFSSVMC